MSCYVNTCSISSTVGYVEYREHLTESLLCYLLCVLVTSGVLNCGRVKDTPRWTASFSIQLDSLRPLSSRTDTSCLHEEAAFVINCIIRGYQQEISLNILKYFLAALAFNSPSMERIWTVAIKREVNWAFREQQSSNQSYGVSDIFIIVNSFKQNLKGLWRCCITLRITGCVHFAHRPEF
jgi:hypothetical protein